MKKTALIVVPLVVVLFFPLLMVLAVAGVGGITAATSCLRATGTTTGTGTGTGLSASAASSNAHGPGAAVAGDPQAQGAQVGSGERLGVLPVVRHAQPGAPVSGSVSMAVANLPQSHLAGRGRSIRAVADAHPDFIALNEVTSSSAPQLAAAARGYGAYKDPATTITRPGAANSLENAVLWDSSRWHLLDAGRFEYVEDDLVVFKGRPVDWNRYATWAILRRASDAAQVVVISTHAMTNPQKDPRTHGDYRWASRVAQYADSMTKLRQLVVQLAAYGPVLLGGDMNVHPSQGSWSAPDQMARNGFGYTFDGAVMYQFFPHGTHALSRWLLSVDSDHPHALFTRIDLHGVGAHATSATSGTAPTGPDSPGSLGGTGRSGSGGTGSGCPPCPSDDPTGGVQANLLVGVGVGVGVGAGPLHDAEVAAAAAYQAGFRGGDLDTMVWIAGGESSYDTRALNSYLEGGIRRVYGLWQISDVHPGVAPPAIYDPLVNAREAFALYRGRGGSRLGDGGSAGRFDDWSAHTAANEATYGAIAHRAIAALAAHVPAVPAVSGAPGGSGGSGADGVVASGTSVPVALRQAAACAAGGALPAGIVGSGSFTANTAVAYVGPYPPGELVARMQKVVALNGTGVNVDPFFATEPDGSWYRDCQHFVAVLDDHPSSGYTSAAAAWSHFLATGVAHRVGSTDAMSPPAGAWLYYGDNHVAIYLGNNLVAGTDTWGNGTAKIGPAADVSTWLASQGGYRGWVTPWGAPTTSPANSPAQTSGRESSIGA